MLQEIKELQGQAVSQIYNLLEIEDYSTYQKEITFKSPTGSGKTYMMSDLMNRILKEDNKIVFLVSTLSKGGLAKQNYEKFCEYKGNFTELNPYLINTETAEDEPLYISCDYNIYILPRDLNKKTGKLLTEGALFKFFFDIKGKLGKRLILIKDECHQATNNLDGWKEHFYRMLNISATPTTKQMQNQVTEISESEAVKRGLIKNIEWENSNKIADALDKYSKIIKPGYAKYLPTINPCLIIQISNKDKAEEEWKKIKKELSKHSELKWMFIVDKDKECDTNDSVKKLSSVKRWEDFAKKNGDLIDIIIFKMKITEGWDIPRACCLFQVRETQSKQLDEQVMGRVRRNPILLNFENYTKETHELALKCWIWGVKPQEAKKFVNVKLKENINVKITPTRLKDIGEKANFDLREYIKLIMPNDNNPTPIFTLYKNFKKVSNETQELCWKYSNNYEEWLKYVEKIKDIEKENNNYQCDYSLSMMEEKPVNFQNKSWFYENKNCYVRIGNWVWEKQGNKDFYFDSEAEKDFAEKLLDLNLPLWGKNYYPNSNVKFDYCLGEKHSSFPDFILKDSSGKIHIFEVKSVIKGNANIDEEEYENKIRELKKCYKQASKITGQIFYLPIQDNEGWVIWKIENGEDAKQISVDDLASIR
jgi:type III restriction enzyme